MNLRFFAKVQIADVIDKEGNHIFLSASSDDNWFHVEINYANTNKTSFSIKGLDKFLERIGEEFGEDVVDSFKVQIMSIATNKRHIRNLKKVIKRLKSLPNQYREEVSEC